MAAPLEFAYTSSEEEVIDDIPHTKKLVATSQTEDLTAPATKGDIKENSKELIQQLQAAHKAVQVRLDNLEDSRRCNNLKIRRIAEKVDDHELLHFVRRLMASLMPQDAAKWIKLHGCLRLTKSGRGHS
ncbi:Hypothetical predicted protein [Pelobates cultripes]|uniref:Uncharacterized protein n=1 Tax=Pelobates cultripes TaxID=61616 RepID=A0AAD1SH57_PELCU|nr:Hypothetical predicted protein [Pelobates cultripes]